jgi:glycosyltransferase involved in cell wall biosynthesis
MRPRVFVNAGGSVSGGGAVYVLSLIDELRGGGDRGVDWHFIIPHRLIGLIGAECSSSVEVHPQPRERAASRFLWEQTLLPLRRDVRESDVLISAANFGPLLRGSRHVLFARNVLHYERAHIAGPKGRKVAVQGLLARLSAKRATVTVTATESMARVVRSRIGRDAVVIPFGPGLVRRRRSAGDPFTFVDRSWWGPHKRLADLLLAVRDLSRTHAGRFVVRSACDPTTRFARSFRESALDRALLSDPRITAHVRFGTFEPRLDDELEGDAVVVTSTTESFCFPLAEAVGAQLPVVAADTPFARELCGGGAFYANPGDPLAFAAAMRRLLDGERPPPYPDRLRHIISWKTHADRLAELCRSLTESAASARVQP